MGPLGGSLGTAKARENPRLGGPPSMGHEGERSLDIPERQVRTTDRYKRQTGKNKQLSRRGCHGIAAGPPGQQGNANPSHKEIPFPTQSDGQKVKKPGDTRSWQGQATRAGGCGARTWTTWPGRHQEGADRR